MCQYADGSKKTVALSRSHRAVLEFDIKKGGDFEDAMLTDKIRALHGRRIKIGGFMLSSFKEDGDAMVE